MHSRRIQNGSSRLSFHFHRVGLGARFSLDEAAAGLPWRRRMLENGSRGVSGHFMRINRRGLKAGRGGTCKTTIGQF